MAERGGAVDLLRLEYVPLEQAALWDENPKLHDIGGLILAIKKHGFKDPMKFEPALNGGKGGLGHGNGRATALKMMYDQGEPPPRGIMMRGDGRWAVPVLFGVDAASEAAAKAYALDHNNLTMAGGEFAPWDISRMWGDEYTAILESLAAEDQLPVTVDGDDLDGLLKFSQFDESDLLDAFGKAVGEMAEGSSVTFLFTKDEAALVRTAIKKYGMKHWSSYIVRGVRDA